MMKISHGHLSNRWDSNMSSIIHWVYSEARLGTSFATAIVKHNRIGLFLKM